MAPSGDLHTEDLPSTVELHPSNTTESRAMSLVRITSDTHLGHELVSGLRGFESIEAHDAAILEALADGADSDTLTWFLGDVAMGDKMRGLRRLQEVPGHKRLILGNHDPIHGGLGKSRDWTPWLKTFEQIHMHAKVKLGGHKFLLSHFPYSGDHTFNDRHEQWRLPDMGRTLLHGHTHGTERVTVLPSGTVQVHVGLDAWNLKPTTPEEILAELRASGVEPA